MRATCIVAFAALAAAPTQAQAPQTLFWETVVDGTNIKMGIASGGLNFDSIFIQCLKRGRALIYVELPENVVQQGKKLSLCFSDDGRKLCSDYKGETDGLMLGGIRDATTTDALFFEMFRTARQMRVVGPELNQALPVKGLSEATAKFIDGCNSRPQ